jgi:hypothetical protein
MNSYDEIQKWCIVIKQKYMRLEILASAFYETGNETMYIRLRDIAQDLREAQRAIESALSDKLDQDYQEMQASIGKTLSVMAKKKGE